MSQLLTYFVARSNAAALDRAGSRPPLPLILLVAIPAYLFVGFFAFMALRIGLAILTGN